MDICGDEQIRKFEELHRELCDIKEDINNLKVGDMKPHLIENLALKVSITINKYEEKVPKTYREEFNFDVSELKIRMSYLQRDYLKD